MLIWQISTKTINTRKFYHLNWYEKRGPITIYIDPGSPWHGDQVPWRWDLVSSPEPLIKNGRFVVPTGPELGVELNDEVARAHVKPGHGFFGVES